MQLKNTPKTSKCALELKFGFMNHQKLKEFPLKEEECWKKLGFWVWVFVFGFLVFKSLVHVEV